MAVAVDEVADSIRSAQVAAEAGNWVVGYISYDAAPGFDTRLTVPGTSDLPLVWFGVYSQTSRRRTSISQAETGRWESTMTPTVHGSSVESIRDAIAAGDTYQANLTFAMETRISGSAEDLFCQTVRSQRKSYAAFLDLGDHQVLSISPELFLAGHGRKVTTRPMKGTAPRGRWSAEDRANGQALSESEKEQAGNIMIVDLLRNDLGKVSVPGSVEASDIFKSERYSTVWQMTSTVSGQLLPEVGLCELLAATFPSGSVTGAPKVSTMDIIAGLESVPRGVYCGAIGYLAPGGNDFEFSVAIRTGVVTGDQLSYHVGGGITYDSDPVVEYEECLWKALVLTREAKPPVLLETMLYQPDVGIELLASHMDRLAGSAEYWDMPFDPSSIGDALSVVEGPRALKVRLMLHPGGAVEVETEAVDSSGEPVELRVASSRVDPSEPWWYHKTLERDRYPTADDGEVLMVNLSGEVTETNISNLMVRFADRWFTPPLESGCLPGVYRQRVLDEGKVEERVVDLDELRSADELAVTNAVRGWRKAVLVD